MPRKFSCSLWCNRWIVRAASLFVFSHATWPVIARRYLKNFVFFLCFSAWLRNRSRARGRSCHSPLFVPHSTQKGRWQQADIFIFIDVENGGSAACLACPGGAGGFSLRDVIILACSVQQMYFGLPAHPGGGVSAEPQAADWWRRGEQKREGRAKRMTTRREGPPDTRRTGQSVQTPNLRAPGHQDTDFGAQRDQLKNPYVEKSLFSGQSNIKELDTFVPRNHDFSTYGSSSGPVPRCGTSTMSLGLSNSCSCQNRLGAPVCAALLVSAFLFRVGQRTAFSSPS